MTGLCSTDSLTHSSGAMGDKECLNIQPPEACINVTDTPCDVSIHLNTTPIEYNFEIYMQFFRCTVKVFIFSFHQVILRFVMGEAAFFCVKLLLDCNIFLIRAPYLSVIIFLPNSHEFSKVNYHTLGFSFFSLDAFAWLLHSTALQRQAEMLSSLFVARKLNGKMMTVPHSAFKYKQLCICICKYKQL